MKNKQKAIEEYQCSGCITGCDIKCFEKSTSGIGCGGHQSGTIISYIGKIFLGLPNGFNRLNLFEKMIPYIYETFDEGQHQWPYDTWNIPVWKHRNKNGDIIVRGLKPRLNQPFIHIFLEDCLDKIDCREISQKEIDAMD